MSKYPDISHYHPVSDWTDAKNNVGFLISKATQGTSMVDSTLDNFIKGCEANAIPYWLYTYLNKGNEKAQAEFMVKTCKDKVGKYFVGYILDVEAGNTADNVKEALDYLNGLKIKTMIYTMYAQYNTYASVIKDRSTNCAWWEARYGLNNGSYSANYPCHAGVDLHQFTSTGTCSGISGKCDLNRLTGTKTESWFKTPLKTTTASKKKTYSGTFPALPPRGYYKVGDGYKTLTNYTTQIKRVQKLLNWIMDTSIVVDGDYGEKSASLCKKFQKKYGLTVDGEFGKKSLAKAKTIKK